MHCGTRQRQSQNNDRVKLSKYNVLFSFRRNVSKDVADVACPGRLFQIRGPAVANGRSPTVARRDGRK